MMTGRIVSHFEILDQLGRGGMGIIYRARDLTQLRAEVTASDGAACASAERPTTLIEAQSVPVLPALAVLDFANAGAQADLDWLTAGLARLRSSPRRAGPCRSRRVGAARKTA